MLGSHIPADLAIDTFDGQAWLGIIPFSMTGVRLRWTPPVPGLSAFPELNVRTYVTAQDKPGVWFFSLDAANALAVLAARAAFHLPYFRARMNCDCRSASLPFAIRAFTSTVCVVLSTCGEMKVIRVFASTLPLLSRTCTGRFIFNCDDLSIGT